MNVIRIQRLSKQHRLLKEFHKSCLHNDIELTAKIVTGFRDEVVLDSSATQLIISKVRQALLGEIELLEKEIKKEATSG